MKGSFTIFSTRFPLKIDLNIYIYFDVMCSFVCIKDMRLKFAELKYLKTLFWSEMKICGKKRCVLVL